MEEKTRLLGKSSTFLFPADLDENGILRSSYSEDEKRTLPFLGCCFPCFVT